MRSAPHPCRPLRSALVAAGMFVVLGGCQSMADGAKESFAKDNICPVERVEVRERPDLRPASFRATATPSTPPPEVAADPARMKMWQDEQEKKSHVDDNHHIFATRGCGKDGFYDCRHSLSTDRCGGCSWVCSKETNVPATISGW